MAVFLEQRMDTRITRETTFHVKHPSRKKLYGQGGQLEQQFGDAPPQHFVNVSPGILSEAAFKSMVDCFYLILFTPYTGLRVKNWQDYQATATNSALTNTTSTYWQLKRKHTFGGVNYLRSIKKPRTGVLIYNAGGTLLTATVDTETGIANVTGTPSYWVGEFDLPMTFSSDEWTAKLEVSTQNLHLVSEPVMMEELL